MRDFSKIATLEGSLTVQSVSPHENVEETVSELINKLSKFCNQSYPAVVKSMQDFVNRTHSVIENSADTVHATLTNYQQQETTTGEGFSRLHPR
ncbi:hypothetical protein D5S17_23695 [Pseudonocardiaceae bacterium YIM PH 21723]|nr:hypothetical protein D5S17_23695 [Pseudonocardiaceae bacterium YIM PH 21723]